MKSTDLITTICPNFIYSMWKPGFLLIIEACTISSFWPHSSPCSNLALSDLSVLVHVITKNGSQKISGWTGMKSFSSPSWLIRYPACLTVKFSTIYSLVCLTFSVFLSLEAPAIHTDTLLCILCSVIKATFSCSLATRGLPQRVAPHFWSGRVLRWKLDALPTPKGICFSGWTQPFTRQVNMLTTTLSEACDARS